LIESKPYLEKVQDGWSLLVAGRRVRGPFPSREAALLVLSPPSPDEPPKDSLAPSRPRKPSVSPKEERRQQYRKRHPYSR
jgi:hypothetical protein